MFWAEAWIEVKATETKIAKVRKAMPKGISWTRVSQVLGRVESGGLPPTARIPENF